jgi:hypothetical protein
MKGRLCAGLILLAGLAHGAAAAETVLRAGAARIDITPPVEELPAPFKVIHDRVYVRALLIDNGATRAAILVADVPAIEAGVYADISRRISSQSNVPLENIVLSASHTHNVMRVANDTAGNSVGGSDKFIASVVAAALEAVKKAAASLQPVRAGYAAGKSYLVSNRNEWLAEQHRFIEGIDRTGAQPIDPTLGVYKFETLSGEPVAYLLNYGIEPVVNIGQSSEISGDVPGEAARYIEARTGGKAVALFTIGPANSPSYRVQADPATGLRDAERTHRIMTAMGTLLGEEAMAAAADIRRPAAQMRIAGALKTLQCPGQITTPRNLLSECSNAPGAKVPACNFKTTAGPPVTLSFGLLKLGDVVLVQADANVVPAMGDRLRRASPLASTMLVLTNFGPLRYVVDDASYPLNTFEVTSTRAQQGCAEQGFIDGVLQMMDRLR